MRIERHGICAQHLGQHDARLDEPGDVVHVVGAHLQLDSLTTGADDGGVDRAIVVLLGRRDVILEPARHDGPFGVDHSNDAIAVVRRSHYGAESINV